jgi:hypothetical protein
VAAFQAWDMEKREPNTTLEDTARKLAALQRQRWPEREEHETTHYL